MSPLLQTAVVLAIVLACGVSVLRRLAPRAAWQAQARLSFFLERPGRPAWLRRLGLALRPPMQATASACGTGGCNTCNGCK
ncbi:DUF6587 family protein [Arenimonas caeni]|jgi:hypothetical protein|uniref:Uncharacterized protein n=1 Tax=Arenimonas caeni TaxID=2058085 RepID=A0A2P6M627_9GAMM|nr:DUF6587 family protein [Arenimonas caeni]MDY0021720.1 hypothetical protein [Arenimonas caeni]PRH81450.1 hypothetical protein C6N40_12700 [Arenimonas caeni]